MRAMRIGAIICLAALCVRARAADTLEEIRTQMLANLERLPNYTCVETVERTRQRAGLTRRDILRLEVVLVDGKEMFAWPGSRKFAETDVKVMAPNGLSSNGNFALHAQSIFKNNGVQFDSKGEFLLEGARLLRYDYSVPRAISTYGIQVGKNEAIVSYHGSIYADPVSLEVRRIQVVTENLPAEVGLAGTSDTVDYQRVRIGSGDFLLPVRSQLIITDLKKRASRNDVHFTNCHLFSSESSLSFTDSALETNSPAASIKEVQLPDNSVVVLTLMEDLELGNGAVGDPIRATLERDIRIHNETVFPKGSIAKGRVTRMEWSPGYLTVGIEFTEMTSENAHADLHLTLRDMNLQTMWELPSRSALQYPPRPGEAVMLLRLGLRRLPRIFSSWTTESHSRKQKTE